MKIFLIVCFIIFVIGFLNRKKIDINKNKTEDNTLKDDSVVNYLSTGNWW